MIADGRGEVLEMEARFATGKPERKLKTLGLPRGTVIGALVREEEVIVPQGDTLVRNGDQVIVFTLPENLEKVEQHFARAEGSGARRG